VDVLHLWQGVLAESRNAQSAWLKGLLTGSCSVGSYGLALWAMTHAPIALVAALRETSILFGMAMAAVALKEWFGCARWLAAGAIMAGVAAMKAI